MLDYDKFKYWQKKLASNQMSQLVPVQLSTLPNNISNDLDVGQVAPLITLCTLTFKNGAELKVHSAEAIPMLLSYMGR
jgi:hypothetical protein